MIISCVMGEIGYVPSKFLRYGKKYITAVLKVYEKYKNINEFIEIVFVV